MRETYHVGNIWRQCLAPFPVFLDHGDGMEVGSSHLVWFDIQLAINTQNIMQIFTCRPKLWWYASVTSLDNTICNARTICKDFEFSVAVILKILNGGYHKNQVICPHILYDLLHSWPTIHKISCKYSHVDQSYCYLEFSVAAILKNVNGGYYKNQVICPQILYDLLYSWISLHKFSCKFSQSYSNFEFSVAAILKIQNGGRYSSQITCLHSYMILTIKNYQYTKFHVLMTIWTI